MLKSPILEPLAEYFNAVQQATNQPMGNTADINEAGPYNDSVLWKIFASTKCYPPNTNLDSDANSGDIAHQFTLAVFKLAKNFSLN